MVKSALNQNGHRNGIIAVDGKSIRNGDCAWNGHCGGDANGKANGNGLSLLNGHSKPNGNGHHALNGNHNGSALADVPDETLLKRIAGHQQAALQEFHSRHNRMLHNVVKSFVHEHETDDVLQEIFLQIWKEAGRYSPKAGKPLGWVVTIARRRSIDRLRRLQAYGRARERYGDQQERQPQRPGRDAEKMFVIGDLRQFLKKRIDNLPRFQREAVELAFFKGLSHSEIAAITGSPLGTVKTRLELGLKKLTQAIKPLRDKI